jgi:uncharacterized membrane protein
MLETLAVLSGALFTGGALYISLVEQPARMSLEARAAAEQFRVSYRRAAPWQVATAVVCAITGVLASVRGAPWSWAAGGLLVGLVVPFTLLVILPTNRRLLGVDVADDAERRRLHRAEKREGVVAKM